jgi:hypothetical protein
MSSNLAVADVGSAGPARVLPFRLRREPARLGHSSPAAALVYQHAADDRDAEIAHALDAMLGAVSEPPEDRIDERPH